MNFKKHSLFILTTLILFFPIGLIFLLRSDHPTKRKWMLGSVGLFLFLSLLTIAFLLPTSKSYIDDFEIYASRKTLTVGQSGGIFIFDDDRYPSNFTVSCDSDILSLNHNVYTAQHVGSARLLISSAGITKSIYIHVVEGDSTLETVYTSPSGKRYHNNKSHAGKNAIEMTEEDAIQSRKTPCQTCFKK